jgi:hypothetical protein
MPLVMVSCGNSFNSGMHVLKNQTAVKQKVWEQQVSCLNSVLYKHGDAGSNTDCPKFKCSSK